MAILNMTTADSILKELYNGQTVENLVYKNRPLLAMLPKMENFVGRNMPLPLIYGNPQNRSRTFSTASGLSSSSSLEQFTLTRVKDYSLAFIDGETLKATESDKGAFISAMKLEVDGAIEALANNLAFSLCRDSSGYMAQVSAAPSDAATTVITLKEPKDIVGFEIGQSIEVYSAKSGGSQRIYKGSTTSGLVSAVDRNDGIVTINTQFDSGDSGNITADDYIFVEGDRGNSISGIEDWIPDSDPSSTAFFGVDRSVDVSRLGGVRFTGTGMSIEEALIDAAEKVSENGGNPDYVFMNHQQYSKLLKTLGSKVQYVDVKANAEIGFRGVEIHGSHGSMIVIPDRNIRDSRAYLLQLDTWVLASLGPAVQLLDFDGNKVLRQSSADAYEARIGSYAQLGCKAPGFNGVVTLD